LLELGWVGALGCGTLVGLAFAIHLFRINGYGRSEGWWSLAYLTVFILLSLSESVVMTAQNLPWVLCVAILARAFDRPDQAS
ncbi:MAG: O-antigen ligase family protein, partial [Brevundimonas sp.]